MRTFSTTGESTGRDQRSEVEHLLAMVPEELKIASPVPGPNNHLLDLLLGCLNSGGVQSVCWQRPVASITSVAGSTRAISKSLPPWPVPYSHDAWFPRESIKVGFPTDLAYPSGNVFKDHSSCIPLKRHGRGSWLCFPLPTHHTFHSLFLLYLTSH
jgi:hypothetical protein